MQAAFSKLQHPSWQQTLAILFIAQLFTAVGFSSFFPFLPLYVRELGSAHGWSTELLSGLVFSGQSFAMMLAAPVWGALADRYGRKLMVERAMFGGSVILLLMAYARSAEDLVILRTIQGLITGTVAAANALIAATVPRERLGFSMGLLQVGLGAGVAVGPMLGGAIADAYGYGAAFFVTAALLFLSGLLVGIGVKEKFKPLAPSQNKQNGLFLEWRQVLSTPGVIPTFGLRFLSQLGRTIIVPVAPLFIQTLLVDSSRLNTFTGLIVGASAATTTISAVYLGRLGDRIGHRRVVIASTLVAAGLYLVQSLASTAGQLLALQALTGIAMGGIIPSISALLAGFTPRGQAGAVYGLDNSIDAAGRTIAPLIGSSVALAFSLRTTFTATALLFLVMTGVAYQRLPKEKAVGDN